MNIIENNKKLPDTKTYQNQYRVFGDKAIIFTTKASNGTYNFRMWIPEEQLYYRKSLRTKLLSDALTLGEQEVISLLTKLRNGHKISGSSWEELCKLFLEKKQKDVQTGRITEGRLITIRSQILKHIIPYIGHNIRVNELDRFKFQDYGNYRRDRDAPAQDVTIRNEYTTINSIIKFGFSKGYLPFDRAETEQIQIKGEISRRDSFTLEEYRVLYTALRKWVKDAELDQDKYDRQLLRDFILLKANTFMRFGEIRSVKWSMCSTISQHKENETEQFLRFDLPDTICKNRRSRTVISRGSKYLNRVKEYSAHTKPTDWIFCNLDGSQFSKKKFYQLWKDAIEYANLGFDQTGKRFSFYSLRHFGITCRLYAQVPIYEVSKLAGTSVTNIENHYSHLDISKLLDSASKSFKVDKDGIIVIRGE